MTSQAVERQYQLALRTAITGDYHAFVNAEQRLRTLDRQGLVSELQHLQMQLVAEARAGREEIFNAGLARFKSRGGDVEKLKGVLLSVPEASYQSFRSYVERVIPIPVAPDVVSSKSRFMVVSTLGGLAAVITITALLFLFIPTQADTDGVVFAPKGSQSDPSPATPMSAQRGRPSLYDQMVASTGMVVPRVEIITSDGRMLKIPVGSGTGFVIRRDGLILTNRHVVESAAEARKKNSLRTLGDAVGWDVVVIFGIETPLVLDAKIVHQSAYVDLAVLRVDHEFRYALAFAPTPEPGASVTAYGFPGVARYLSESLNERESKERWAKLRKDVEEGRDLNVIDFVGTESLKPSVTRGIVSAVRNTEGGMMVQTDTFVHGGNSGGPLVNEDGLVVAMVTLGAVGVESVNMGIASKTIFEELSHEQGIRWPQSFD